jgi:tetraacyldisaccharide 4'-kinase
MGLLRIILLPLAFIFGCIARLRNLLFDLGIFPVESFDIPVISVGNLSMGGTGKTPHVEYLVRMLRDRYRVAVLSRGYGRLTKGFLLAEPHHTYRDIGDEPMLYKKNFPDLMVAVDADRRHGIHKLMGMSPPPGIILLDDAYQHRYVKPGLSILLTDYYHLYTRDYLIPAGRLREPILGAKRANVIIVTKTDSTLSPLIERELLHELNPRQGQHVCYSYVRYGDPVSLRGEGHDRPVKLSGSVLMVAGIADPYPLELYLRNHFNELERLIFSDHHVFTPTDAAEIRSRFKNIIGRNKIIITTEKDAMRLKEKHITDQLNDLPAYYLPVTIEFHPGSKRAFHSCILRYVGKNQ